MAFRKPLIPTPAKPPPIPDREVHRLSSKEQISTKTLKKYSLIKPLKWHK